MALNRLSSDVSDFMDGLGVICFCRWRKKKHIDGDGRQKEANDWYPYAQYKESKKQTSESSVSMVQELYAKEPNSSEYEADTTGYETPWRLIEACNGNESAAQNEKPTENRFNEDHWPQEIGPFDLSSSRWPEIPDPFVDNEIKNDGCNDSCQK